MGLTPKTRKEVFLAAAGSQDVPTPTPITREEMFLDAIAKNGGSGGGSSGGGVLVVNVSQKTDSKSGDTKGPVTTPYVCDKTTGEMWSALTNGNGLLFYNATYSEFDTLKYAWVEDGAYEFAVATGGSTMIFISDSVDAYPETTS